LSYEEWLAIKKKQDEILTKWQEANQQENKNIELINTKINEEYNNIKNENYAKWLEKKREEKNEKRGNRKEEI